MGFKKSVLWIEDDAAYNLDYLASPLIMNPRYDLVLATSISEALHALHSRPAYDAIVFDLRVPPGNQANWKALHQELSQARTPAQLGFYLLLGLFDLPHPMHHKHNLEIPLSLKGRVNIQSIGIMSVDVSSTVLYELQEMQVNETQQLVMDNLQSRIQSTAFYKQKQVGMSNRSLLELVKAIIDGGGEPHESNTNMGTGTPTRG